MNTKEKLTADLKDAMRARDTLRKRVLRLALASIKNAEIEKQAELSEAEVVKVLQKEVKERRDTIEGAQKAGRADLVAEAEAEITVLETYLPQQLSEAELEALVRGTIAEVGAASMREMGKVMSAIMPKVQGRADGKAVSQMVRKLLTG
jgi:uncharacterized protein YqeY